MWEHGRRARGVWKGSKWEKGERNVKVEVSLRGVCLYAKRFHLSGDWEGWGRWKAVLTSARVGCKITTLHWLLTKAHPSLDWTCNPHREKEELVSLGGKRDHAGRQGAGSWVSAPARQKKKKKKGLACSAHSWFYCFLFTYNVTTKSTQCKVITLLPAPTQKMTVQESQIPGGPDVAEGRWLWGRLRILGSFLKSWRHHGKCWLSNSWQMGRTSVLNLDCPSPVSTTLLYWSLSICYDAV